MRKFTACLESFALVLFAGQVWYCLWRIADTGDYVLYFGIVALNLGWPHRWLVQRLAGDGA